MTGHLVSPFRTTTSRLVVLVRLSDFFRRGKCLLSHVSHAGGVAG